MKTIINDIIQRLTPTYSPNESRELAYWLLEETTGLSRTQLLTLNRDTISIPNYDSILQRLLKKEPIQYIFGHTTWCGLDLQVSPATLIPRPETAELVYSLEKSLFSKQASLDAVGVPKVGPEKTSGGARSAGDIFGVTTLGTDEKTALKILDIGTGSGCIAILLKLRHPEYEVFAMDISPAALQIAQSNALRCSANIHFLQGDIFTDEIGHFDIIVSNPPYIRESEKPSMDSNVLDYEPHSALFVPDSDPLCFYRRIAEIKRAPLLAFEINQALGDEMVSLMQSLGYTDIQLKKDSYGNDRILLARLDESC